MSKFPDYVVPCPNVGDKIYIPGAMYCSHGEDDYVGGLVTVRLVEEGISGGNPTHYVGVEGWPASKWNWEYLAEEQAELKERFGDDEAYHDPDDRPEFNKWATAGDTVDGVVIDYDIP